MNRFDSRPSAFLRVLALAAATGVLGGCSTLGLSSDEPKAAPAASSSSSFSEFFRNGGSTTPPPPRREDDDFECPSVEILDGGASVRQEAGGSVRSQISMGQVARECRSAGPGQIAIKVGAEARILLGQAGSPGSYGTPVRFLVKRGDTVLVSRVQRGSATIPAGETQATFVVVEDNMVVPREGDELSIFVGFDPTGRAGQAPRKRKGG
jgi:hypothetical protein